MSGSTPASGPTPSDLEAASGERDALRLDNAWLKGEVDRWALLVRRRRWEAWIGIALAIASLVVLCFYTVATYSLENAANKQLEVAHQQLEIATTPLVVLGVADGSADLVVRNIGLGPALDAGDIVIGPDDMKLTMLHVAALRPGQAERVAYVKTVDGQRVDFGSNVAEELKKMIPEVKKEVGVDFSITYSDMYRNRYETKQSLRFSTDPALPGMSGIILQFKGRNPIQPQASPPANHEP